MWLMKEQDAIFLFKISFGKAISTKLVFVFVMFMFTIFRNNNY